MRNKDKSSTFVTYAQQQLIDCDKFNFGCNGGWPYNALDWLSKNGGIMKEEDYPPVSYTHLTLPTIYSV